MNCLVTVILGFMGVRIKGAVHFVCAGFEQFKVHELIAEAFHEHFASFSLLINTLFDGISSLNHEEPKQNIFTGLDTKERSSEFDESPKHFNLLSKTVKTFFLSQF